MQNILGIVISMGYIFASIAFATFISKRVKNSEEISRKIIHILSGNWVFLTPIFTDLRGLLFVPFCFIFINLLSMKYDLFPAMERKEKNYGTVFYAISMFVLSLAGFVFRWRILPYVGLLTMAYGDGLAAIFGQKWGKKSLFAFAPKKTEAGSAVVGASAFVITFVAILVFRRSGEIPVQSFGSIILISAIVALFSIFIEAAGKDGCDNLTLPIGSGLLATFCVYYGSLGFYTYLLIAGLILYFAYKARAITQDGIIAALLTAMTLYSFGGSWLGASLLAFFVSGSAVSRLNNAEKKEAEKSQEIGGTRNWKQVLCNSLPACILMWIFLWNPEQKLLLLAFAVFSSAAADTFASEIGMLSKGKVFNILNGKPVRRGLSGGVSWAGLGAGLLGSFLMSLFALPQFGWKGFLFVAGIGFVSSLIDSIIGAAFQKKYADARGILQDRQNYANEKPAQGLVYITNNTVNMLSLAFTSIFGYLISFAF